jgi:hypothetical protein
MLAAGGVMPMRITKGQLAAAAGTVALAASSWPSMRSARIEPCPTLDRQDLPYALQDEYGGWQSRDAAMHLGDMRGSTRSGSVTA